MKTKIIIGLGYGDEGKGITTDYLCRKSKNPFVVRFSGGHQAGHTVVLEDGTRHVFSSFGAGTLQGVPSYWSQYCTLYPLGFFNELQSLLEKGFSPKIYVDAKALVTTPYDIFFNRKTEKINQHGSCGLGFGATVARDKYSPYKLYVQDLFYPEVLKNKLKAIQNYYQKKTSTDFYSVDLYRMEKSFMNILPEVLSYIHVVHEKEFFNQILPQENITDLIFEGSQGILLDMDHGFFPHVTHANTVSKNAIDLIEKYKLKQPEIFYITRAYQTRHGNGFLSNEEIDFNIISNPNETNQFNAWQGHQRISPLDIDLIDYALQCDNNYSFGMKKNIVITCLDQIENKIKITKNKEIFELESVQELIHNINFKFDKVIESRNECSNYMKEISMNENVLV